MACLNGEDGAGQNIISMWSGDRARGIINAHNLIEMLLSTKLITRLGILHMLAGPAFG